MLRLPLGLILGLLASSVGCPRGTDRTDASIAAAPAPRVLILGATQEPDSLDPVRSETAGAREVLALLHRGLGSYDERWLFRAGLAERPAQVRTSSRGTTLEFRLRPGIRWSDGRPVVAADFVFGHRVVTDPELANRTISAYRVIERVEAPAKDRLVVTLAVGALPEHVFSLLLALPEHVSRDGEGARRDLDRAPVTNGPYALSAWRPGESIELVRRMDQPGPVPWFERIVFRFFESEDAFEAALLTGRIDALGEASGLSAGKAARLAQRLRGTHVVQRTESGVWLQVSIRHDHPLTGELGVRRAMDLALDREALSLVVYDGEATPAAGLFPARHPVGLSRPTAKDLARARKSLEDAGFRRRGDFYEKNGRRLELEMSFATGSEASERAASFIAASLAEVPIVVRLRGAPLRVLLDKLRDPGRAPLAMLAWRLPPDWDAAAVLSKDGAKNYGAFHDSAVERALEAARTATSSALWRDRLADVDRLATEQVPVLSLVFRRSVSVRPVGLAGWKPTGTMTPVTWNAESWRWHEPKRRSSAPRLDGPTVEE